MDVVWSKVSRWRFALVAMIASCLAIGAAAPAAAQLRIVTYNSTNAPRSGTGTILQAIGEEEDSGVKRPIDILLLQEQDRSAGLPDTQAFVTLLNSIYSSQGITYARSTLSGAGDDTQAMVYRTSTVQLLEQTAIGNVPAEHPRQSLRYRVKPFGYEDSAAFYIYNSHFRASEGAANVADRLAEANSIRINADALGEGTHAILAGDLNIYRSSESPWGRMTEAGAGRFQDPINRIGSWHENLSYADVHTQSPTVLSRFGGQAPSGMDDRFDFQLVTDEFLDSEGISYISGTYRAFGNNGTTYNSDIDSGTNTYPFDGIAFTPMNPRSALLTALASSSDHIPVIADYRIPAKMGVQVASIRPTVSLAASVMIDVFIENIAPASSAGAADELDYTLSVTGDLIGGISSIEPASGGGHTQSIFLNTATPGVKSGMITVTSSSQQASNALFTMPVSFTVLGPSFLAADFNQDGSVNNTDLMAWRGGFGTGTTKAAGDADADGDVDGADFLVWQRQLGLSPSQLAANGSVPEPGSAALVGIAGLGLFRRRRR
jgi:endonuclease/exonuclease/phosphatase family metal-dependent hydrolase